MSELEAQLRGGGEVVSTGTFRIDAQRALKKLREHRLAEPHHWVLEVLRAAHLSHARRVEVRIDADDVEVTFDGKSFPRALMEDLLAQSLGAGDRDEEQRGRLLSLGVAGALALDPKWVRVESGGVKLEVHRGDKVVLSQSDATRTRVSVRKALGWNVLAGLLAKSPEHQAIADRARWFSVPLTVNGDRVDGPMALTEDALLSSKYEGAFLTAVVAYLRRPLALHRLTLVSQGVIIVRRELEAPGLPCEVLVKCDGLRRNASGSDVVEADALTQRVFAKVGRLTLGITEEAVAALAAGRGAEQLREHLAYLAVQKSDSSELRAILEKAPLLPGPSGEWYSIGDFRTELLSMRPIRYSLESCEAGTYPTPTVLLSDPDGDPRLALLPGPPTQDVKELVKKAARAAQAKALWARQPVELPAVEQRDALASARLSHAGVAGEVALLKAGSGAFVRFLCKGRFLQQGEVELLAPLRLRATVDWQKDVPEKLWAEMPSRKLWSIATRAIEAAAASALQEALRNWPEAPGPLEHAIDFLVRHVRAGKDLLAVPPWLAEAKVFSCLDGSRVSLAELAKSKSWKFTPLRLEQGLMSGERVLVLDDERRNILFGLAKDRLADVTGRLDKERALRVRLAASKEKPQLSGMFVTLPIEGEGLSGEVGVPAERSSQLNLTLLKAGVRVERTNLSAQYGQAWAVVDCAGFSTDADWEKVERDATFDRALRAVRAAEARLAPAIVARLRTAWQDLPPGCAAHLLAFLQKEVDLFSGSELGPAARAVAEARIFSTSAGRRSLLELRAAVEGEWDREALYVRPLGHGLEAEGLLVVAADEELAVTLGKLLRRTPISPDAEVQRRRRLRSYLARPEWPVALPPNVPLVCEVAVDGARGVVGLDEGEARAAQLELVVQQRNWGSETVAAHLPLVGCLEVEGVDPLETALPPEAMQRLGEAVRAAEQALVTQALEAPAEPTARRLLMLALGGLFDLPPSPAGAALLETPLFPCTDGLARSANQLASKRPIFTCSRPLEGALASGAPVVVAEEALVQVGLARFTEREDVTEQLERELVRKAARARQQRHQKISFAGDALLRRAFCEGGVEGEVVISAGHPGRLDLFQERKSLCTLEGELPPPFAAAANFDPLQPSPDAVGVARDSAFGLVLARVIAEAEALAGTLADEFAAGDAARRALLGRPALQAAVWAVKRETVFPKLAELPLLESTTGEPLSLRKLLSTRRGGQAVRTSAVQVAALDPRRWVWRPRPLERELLEPLGLKFADYTDELEHAQVVRKRPRIAKLAAPGAPAWVEPVNGKTAEGEVGLVEPPAGALVLEVLRERTLLERWSTQHPVGAVGQVNCDALAPTAGWKRAVRNRAFKAMVGEVEDALERLVARRLAEGPAGPEHRALALAGVKWSRAPDGPLAKVLPGLELFFDLSGAPVTLGRVAEEHLRSRRVAVARAGLGGAQGLVLTDGPLTRELLSALGLELEDVSELLARAEKLEASRRARRLAELKVTVPVLVRLPVAKGPVRGELALPLSPADRAEPAVLLARDGVAVSPARVEGELPVVGVLDDPALEVNEEWTRARPGAELQAILRDGVEALYGALAAQVQSLSAEHRAQARARALELLAHRGMTHATALDRMTGAAQALSRAPLFRTPGGDWLTLAALADHVARGERVGIVARRFFKPDTGDALVIEAEALDALWLEALARVLGPRSIERIEDVEEWKRERAEEDPQSGTPLLKGLTRLRRHMKLLRSGALGQLSPKDLEDVRLTTARPRRAISYDRARQLVLLDGADPAIVRALTEATSRPERLYVLLTAIYGEVNRALEHVTDEHEADLLGALAVHLAANPGHLHPADAAPAPAPEPAKVEA